MKGGVASGDGGSIGSVGVDVFFNIGSVLSAPVCAGAYGML